MACTTIMPNTMPSFTLNRSTNVGEIFPAVTTVTYQTFMRFTNPVNKTRPTAGQSSMRKRASRLRAKRSRSPVGAVRARVGKTTNTRNTTAPIQVMAARRWSQRIRARSRDGMRALSPSLQGVLARRAHCHQKRHYAEKYRDSKGWDQGWHGSGGYGMRQVKTPTQCRHAIGERVAVHHPDEPGWHASHREKSAREQPQGHQEQIHDGVKTLRGAHPPGNDQAKIGHAKGNAKKDHNDEQERQQTHRDAGQRRQEQKQHPLQERQRCAP